MTNKKKKMNNKKISDNNQKSIPNKYFVLGIAALVAIVGITINYPYFISSNATNSESSSDKSNLLGDWHDIHGVGIFNAEGSSDNDNSIYLANHNGLYNKKQNSSELKLEMMNLI